MAQYFIEISYIHWLSFAMVTFIIASLVIRSFLICAGIAAITIAIIMQLLTNVEWQQQYIIFIILTPLYWVFYVFLSNIKYKIESKNNHNIYGHQHIGRTACLKEDLVNGRGCVAIDDNVWQVRTKDNSNISNGLNVKIVDVIQTTLIIEKQIPNIPAIDQPILQVK